MFGRIKKMLKDFDERVLKKDEEEQKLNFKGQR